MKTQLPSMEDPLGIIIEREEGSFTPYLQVGGPFNSEAEAEQTLAEAAHEWITVLRRWAFADQFHQLEQQREAQA